MSTAKAEREYVLRDTSSIVTFWVAIAVLVALMVLLSGDWLLFAFVLPFGLFFAWALWAVLLRPKIRYNPTRVIVVNILRTFETPWARVKSVEQRLNLVFTLDDGTKITAAGVSAPRGPGVVLGGITGKIENGNPGFSRDADTLEAYRHSAKPSDGQLMVRWNRVQLGVGVVLLVAVIVDIIIAATTA